MPSNNTSGIKGVFYHKKHEKWVSHIKIKGKSKTIGYFENKYDAAVARMDAENLLGFDKCDFSTSAAKYVNENATNDQRREETP